MIIRFALIVLMALLLMTLRYLLGFEAAVGGAVVWLLVREIESEG